jgi:hypothetical protein
VVVVRVDQVGRAIRVAGQVKLDHAVGRDVANVFRRVEVVVHTGDVDIVHIQQQAAIRLLGHAG